jgi:hypothetical protein
MFNPPEGWLWWTFSVLGVGTFLGIAVNLASNRLQKYLDQHFEQRRKRRLAYNRFEAEYVENMAKLADSDSTVLTVMACLVDIWQTRATRMLMFGQATIIAGLILSVGSFALLDAEVRFAVGVSIFGAIGNLGGLFSIILGNQTQKSADLYSAVIFAYHEKHHIPLVVADK